MKRTYSLIICLMLAVMAWGSNKASYDVVPLPRSIQATAEKPFVLSSQCFIAFPENNSLMERNARFLSAYITKATGIALSTQPYADNVKGRKAVMRKTNAVVLTINPKVEGKEAYRLTVSAKGIAIEGSTPNGVFYGIQTMRKSLPVLNHAQERTPEATVIEMPAAIISDCPRFGYRGMHLDISRHFFPVDVVKEYIDIMALHNMNTFHWHISDDQGWRIEIKKYPRLAQLGSQRSQTVIGRNMGIYDNTPYGGYYTQEQAREVVAYAQERHITVIPEIDMPGHMLGALKAYPELGCTGGPYEVEGTWGVFDDILCAGNDKTFEFVEGVLDEIMQIFPSEIIHIGGDEAPRTRWKACPKCQQRIRELSLKGDGQYPAEAKLQGYFTSRVEKYLNDRGRRILGWDELLEGDVNPSAMIMSWRGVEGGLQASAQGHDVVMAPTSHCYFDYYQEDPENWCSTTLFKGFVSLEKAYSLDPAPESLPEEAQKHILGAQANIWTEYIPYKSLLQYQMLPRAGALSEVQWVMPAQKDYQQFLQRERRMLDIYRLYGYTFCPAEFKEKK